jgi:hypothetical protein
VLERRKKRRERGASEQLLFTIVLKKRTKIKILDGQLETLDLDGERSTKKNEKAK